MRKVCKGRPVGSYRGHDGKIRCVDCGRLISVSYREAEYRHARGTYPSKSDRVKPQHHQQGRIA